MLEKALEEIIVEFQKSGIPDMFDRELNVPIDIESVVTIVGLRRVGKTYYLYQVIKNLLKKGVERQRIFYINFEDERLENITSRDLSKIVEIYYKMNPAVKNGYFFFDEIQNVPSWERFVRRLAEKKGFRIFLTGSSSKLLSKEIATALRGRTISFNLLPLSFREFVGAKGIDTTEPLTEMERGMIKMCLDEFVKYGGFPELLGYDKNVKLRMLKEYLDLIIYRDLIERYGIEKVAALKFMIRLLVRNFSRELSVRKLYNFLKSSNISLSKNKVYEYFSYLEDMNFIFLIRRYGRGKEVERSIPKIYLCDVGFATLQGVQDIGRRMENIVGLELLRRKEYFEPMIEIYYWKDTSGREVDFVIKMGQRIEELIQVCYDLDDPNTKSREFAGLLKASSELKCKNLSIITWETEGTKKFNGAEIKFVPLWKWLLDVEISVNN